MTPALPATMRAAEITRPGPPDVLKLCTRPLPVPRNDEILIRIAFAGVNRPDALQRAGAYPPPAGASDLPGLEASGEVVAAGLEAGSWKPGDKVMALLNGGGYAEYATVHGGHVLAVPEGLSLAEAAALPETLFTVWVNVFERAQLRGGESLLIHGGSSGIGTTAIQMARLSGVRVFVTAGSAEKCAACEALGADLAINYREEDFVAAVKGATDGRGADVILDMVGGDYVAKNIRAAAIDGRIINIAFLQGAEVTVNLAPAMVKRLSWSGSTLRPRSIADKAQIRDALEARMMPFIRAGRLKPVMDREFTLSDAAGAHTRMESSHHIGKIVLKVSG